MPGRRVVVDINPDLCRRCQAAAPAITVRNEPLCTACFCRYVQSKVVKRMESFRVRHAEPGKEPTLLLPLSFGPCSVALLHILSHHLSGQVDKTGRTGFKLRVLHVSMEAIEESAAAALLEAVRQRYPSHVYSIAALGEQGTNEGLSDLRSTSGNEGGSQSQPEHGSVETLFNRTTSATSRADLSQILLRKTIVSHAKHHGCEAIVMGDSTTRLAERTLAETAKGRGFSLPWTIAEGQSPHGVSIHFPQRDLLTSELAAYATSAEPPLSSMIVPDVKRSAVVSARNTTIDDLMRQYFDSVERDYPSIVANVVRTAAKLQAPSLDSIDDQCELCDMPLQGKAPDMSRLCYGCIRTLPPANG